MGNPRNYSLELPTRCLALIDDLWGTVLAVDEHTRLYGGPLTTTFLLAMATPMIVLPVERILIQIRREGVADDRKLDTKTADRVRAAFADDVQFGATSFFQPEDGWAYVFSNDKFNLAQGLPPHLADSLSMEEARGAAGALSCKLAIKGLRNGLAHGVVGFLDKNGHSTYGESASMLAFVSESRDADGRLEGLHVLRISETGFRSFLHRWVDWLNHSGVAEAMAA